MSELGHASNCRDGARRVVPALDAPGRDGAVVHRGSEGEVGFDVPLEVGQDVALALELLDELGVVVHVVEDGEPVTRRGFRVGTVRPKLRQHPCVVATRHHVGRVGGSRRRVHAVTRAWRTAVGRVVQRSVGLEGGGVVRAVADRGGADVPHDAVGGVEHARPKRHHAVTIHVNVRCSRAVGRVKRRLSRVVVHFVFKPVARVGREVGICECPRRHLSPLRRQEGRGFSRDGVATLVDEQVERQRLPAVHVHHRLVAGQVDDEGRIDRSVGGVGVAVLFVRSVLKPKYDRLLRQVVAQGTAISSAVVGAGEGDVVPECGHVHVVPRAEVRGLRGVREAMLQKAVHPVGDGFVARRRDVRGGSEPVKPGHKSRVVLAQEGGAGGRLHHGPRVPHQHGAVPEVAGVNRGTCEVSADALEEHFVPLARHAVAGSDHGVFHVFRAIRARVGQADFARVGNAV